MSDEMDHLLTPAQKRARTRERKKQAMLEQMGVEPRKAVKPRRKRKPMTEEQRAAAVERLAKAGQHVHQRRTQTCILGFRNFQMTTH